MENEITVFERAVATPCELGCKQSLYCTDKHIFSNKAQIEMYVSIYYDVKQSAPDKFCAGIIMSLPDFYPPNCLDHVRLARMDDFHFLLGTFVLTHVFVFAL